jgi:uncharacterized protein (TIGR03435 family)
MRRSSWCVLGFTVIGAFSSAVIRAQNVPPRPHFEVASVKRNTACGGQRGEGPSPGRFNLECTTVLNLIQLAYGAFANGVSMNSQMLEITGAPDWVTSDAYRISAKAEGDAAFARMAGPMLQALLEERFGLKVHREAKDVAVYFLTVAKAGAKLDRTKEGSCVPIDADRPPATPEPGQPRPLLCGSGSVTNKGSTTTINQHGMTMGLLAGGLANFAGRPVLDKTGLTGPYEIHLEFTPDNPLPGPGGRGGLDDFSPAPAADAAGPSLFTALQEQLGLRLEAGKGQTEILVIDHVERPSEN